MDKHNHADLILAGVPQDSILGLLLFLIYINDLPNGLKTNTKLFTDDISLISKWAFNWKILLNPGPHKLVQEVLFSRKKKMSIHPVISLNNIQVEKASYQKHLGLFLDEKLTFKYCIDNTLCEVNKGIAVIKKLRHTLPRKSLLAIYKEFLRPLIDYGDIIYDQPHNSSFSEKLESVQYKATLAITGVIQVTFLEMIVQELGVESLKYRRWFRRLCCMFKIMKNEVPNFLISLIPKREQTFNTRSKHLLTYNCRTNCFKYSFFPCTLND